MLVVGSTMAQNDIAVKELASNRFELTLTSRTVLDVGAAQAMLISTADSLCPGQHAQLGRYQFASSENVGQKGSPTTQNSFEMVQEVSCVDKMIVPDNDTPKPLVSDLNDRQLLEQHVRSMSKRYFEDVYSGKYAEGFDVMSAEMKSFRAYGEWVAQMDEFRADAGPVVTINVHTITIYDSPPNAPQPGLYIAADYQNSLRNAPFHCGYLIWFRGESGEFQIIREESGVLTDEIIKQIPEEDHEDILAQMRCKPRPRA